MSSHTGGYYYPTQSAPITMPHKNQNPYYAPYPVYPQGPYARISVSPPEVTDSSTTSGGGSYDPTGTSSSYAASASDYDPSSSSGGASIDLLEYMNERMHGAFDPIPLDRSLAQQAQTSGQLNDKTRKIMELQALAQKRLAAAQASFADGIKTAREVQRDLEWTQKRVTSINQRAAKKYPQEYAIASSRYPGQEY